MKFQDGEYIPIDKNAYDVIVKCCGTGYAHKNYEVIKNAPRLSDDDIALICDNGNLCFGYRGSGRYITVHTD